MANILSREELEALMEGLEEEQQSSPEPLEPQIPRISRTKLSSRRMGSRTPPDPERGAPEPREAQPSQFSQIEGSSVRAHNNFDLLMDIKLPVSVELGRTQMLVRDILDFGPGTVVELDKQAQDPVDILVNGQVVARGEFVIVDDHFGVRVTIVLSPAHRERRGA